MLAKSSTALLLLLMHWSTVSCWLPAPVPGQGNRYGYGFTYVRGSKPSSVSSSVTDVNQSNNSSLDSQAAPQPNQIQADSPYSHDDAGRASYPQWMTDAIPADDELNSQRSLYKNPRNVPSDSCPRDEDLAVAQGRTCLRKCTADEDCRSPRKKCLCDGICGLSCIKPDKECHELGNPDKGQVILTGRFFGDRAMYSCEEGYRLVGVDFRLCQADGSWSATEPSCQKIVQSSGYCGEPPTVPHARHNAPMEQNSFTLDTELQYQCYPGYNTIGFARARCLAYNSTVKWFGPDVTCEPRSCGEPGDILHGRHEGDCYAYSCRVTYSCHPGFDILGRANRYCQADGTWTPAELPICVPVQCPIPTHPENGKVIFTSVSYNSVVSYTCNYGFTMVGQSTRRCGSDKKWIGEEPYCKEINCGPPGPVYNGWIENAEQKTSLGTSVIYRCFDGMKRIGASSATCEKSGRWSYNPPQCLSPCVVPSVEFGVVDNVSTGALVEHGENLTLQCSSLYEPAHGLSSFSCNNGTWNVIPRCEPARCKSLPKRPRHGMVIAPRIEHGTRALFKCKDGFQLVGPNTTECMYGNWSEVMPVCQEIYCPFPGYIENGKVLLVGNMGLYDYRPYVRKVTNNRQIMYECDRGYMLDDGPPGATCVAGKWSPKQMPRCLPGQHPRVRWARSVKSGRAPVGAAVRKAGKNAGKGMRRKNKGSSRNNDDNDAEDNNIGTDTSCTPLVPEAFATFQIVKPGKNESEPFSIGIQVNVTCQEGYRPNVSNGTARCKRGGVWKPDKPGCFLIPCVVPVVENAAYRYDHKRVAALEEIPSGEPVEFGCEPGYVVHGPEIMRCSFGKWNVTQNSSCIPAPCELPRIHHGDYSGGYRAGLTIANGSTVDYTCQGPEYAKANPLPVWCRLGELLPEYPACKSRQERGFGYDEHGKAIIEEVQFKGGSDITEGGKMEFSLSERKACSPPTRFQGTLLFKDGEPLKDLDQRYPHGTQVTFHCVSGILRDKTTWQIICEEGNWIGRPLACEGDISVEGIGQPSNKTCNFRNNKPNVVTFYGDQQVTESSVDFPPGTELVARCQDVGKFAFVGSVRRRCSRGKWTGMEPQCFGLSQENDYALEKPPTVLFRHELGPIAQTNDGKLIVYPGTILHMECLWIRRFGTPKWDVSQNYRKYPTGWTEDESRDRNLEYRLSIFHAQKDDTGIYTCTTPKRYTHSVEIVVRPVHCAPIPITERRGLAISTKNTKMNTKVHFSCQNGNSLVGAPEVTCLPSGNWNAPIPFCESVLCPDTVPLGNVSSTVRTAIVNRAVGGKALFTCAPGHSLVGPSETQCLPTGDWAHASPQCEEVVCEPPESPENGYIQGGSYYKAGDVVQFHCHRGFMMDGQPIAACQENGKWSGTVPKCSTACPYPGTTIGGTISLVKFYYSIGETVTFDCSLGLVLNGSRQLRCQKNGKWSAAIPTCIPATN